MVTNQAAEHHTGTEPITDEFLLSFLERWRAAWNSHDPERVIGLMTPDCTYDDAAWPTTMRTPGDVREFLHHTWTAVPDLEFYEGVGARSPGRNGASYYWKARGRMTGPLTPPGYAPTGGIIEFDGFDYHEYRDGKVARLRIIFNLMDLGQQIGAVPRPGTALERPVVWLQRFKARRIRSRSRTA